MSIITGLQAEAYDDFAEDFEDGVLIVPGEQVSDGQGGYVSGQPIPHPCKALVTDYDVYRRPQGVPASDRLILVLGGSLPAGVIPAGGHKITAPDPAKGLALSTFDVIAKTGDPAAALYELQGR